MKTPICTFDAKTGILCNLCESKLESGQITQSDVESSIVLTRLAQKNSSINKMTLVSAKEIENEHILILKKQEVDEVIVGRISRKKKGYQLQGEL